MQPAWMKICAAAKFAGVSTRSLRGWLRQGLRCSRLPSGLILISTTELDNFLKGFENSSNQGIESIVEQVVNELQH